MVVGFVMKNSSQDKGKTIEEAAKLVKNGDTITFNGIGVRAQPIAFTHELIRQRKRNIEIAGSAAWHVNNLLIGAGCVDSVLIVADSIEFGKNTASIAARN
jgi:acyl CoA:acetate/3-ketoacid CoA transferase alpha subunit